MKCILGCSQSEIALGFLPKCPLIVPRLTSDLKLSSEFSRIVSPPPQIVRCETARQCCVMSVQSALDVSANYICDALQLWWHDIHLMYIMGAEYVLHFLTEAVGSLCAGVCQLESKLWPVSVFDDTLFCCWHPMLQISMIWELLRVENIALMTRGEQLDLMLTKLAKKLSNKINEIEQQKWLGAAVDSSCNSS